MPDGQRHGHHPFASHGQQYAASPLQTAWQALPNTNKANTEQSLLPSTTTKGCWEADLLTSNMQLV